MLTQATFEGFKRLVHVTLPLGQLNVVVGANGVGKSSLLEGLELLLRTTEASSLGSGVWPAVELFTGRSDPAGLVSRPNATECALTGHWPRETQFTVTVCAREASSDWLRVRLTHGPETYDASLKDRGAVDEVYRRVAELDLGGVTRLQLDPRVLALPSVLDGDTPRLADDGSGLAAVLQEAALRRDGLIEAIEADLAKLVPGVRRIRTTTTKVEAREALRILVGDDPAWTERRRVAPAARLDMEFDRVGVIPAERLSEGTLLLLGLITAVRTRNTGLLLLDDLDKALHPAGQRELIGLLRGLLADRPSLQVVATSHSPFVLDALAAEEVFVAGPGSADGTAIRRMDRHVDWARRGKFMHPGEFWSVVGEGWVGAAAAPEGV